MPNKLNSYVHPLLIPLLEDEATGWKFYPVFCGSADGLGELECHVSVLNRDRCPHPPHSHPEEELLLLLSGEVELILPGESPPGKKRRKLESGEFVYYPSGFAHTLRTTSDIPANYLMLKWSGRSKNKESLLGFDLFCLSDFEGKTLEGKEGFHPQIVFEGPTAFLHKLHCHFSTLSPGSGYIPHADPYHVVVVVLGGVVETLGRRVEPYGVIFYKAGAAHGLRNPDEKTAKYIVFEFHGGRTSWLVASFAFALSSLAGITDPRRWMRKLRRLFQVNLSKKI
jgi:mannose-6-phosphate isomerase-like protein (cupin superfamily)